MKLPLIILLLAATLTSCHHRIHSSSWQNYGQFLPPIMTPQTYRVFHQPTPYDYVEVLYLGEDSTFVQLLAGQINLDPIQGRYETKCGKVKLFPDHSERTKSNKVVYDRAEPGDKLHLTGFSTWDYQIPLQFMTIAAPDTTIYESFFFPADTIQYDLPESFDTLTVYSTYLDNRPVEITPEMLQDNNRISIHFGMSQPDSYRLGDKATWRFSFNKKRLKHQRFSWFRKKHPYYYKGEFEVKE